MIVFFSGMKGYYNNNNTDADILYWESGFNAVAAQ